MNCFDVRSRLDDYVDGYSAPMERIAVDLHVRTCRNCSEALTEERALRTRLRAVPAPEPDMALFSHAIAAAAEAEERRMRQHRWRLAGGAMAAALVLALGFGMEMDSPVQQQAAVDGPVAPAVSIQTGTVPVPAFAAIMPSPEPVQAVTVVLQQESEISLALESGRNIDAATFTVELPEGVELSGYPGVRQVTWTGRLESGKNLLVLPIKVQTGNGGDIVAHVADDQDARRRSLTLRMDVVQPTAPSLPAAAPAAEPITVM